MRSGYVAVVSTDLPGRPRALALAVLVTLLGAAAIGCGGGGEGSAPAGATTDSSPTASTTPATSTAAEPPPAPPRPPPCPPSDNCERAAGEIAYVERLDPDGDGDAHFVLLSRESITAPGISVIDVRADLRPHPLPVPGDQLAASGPVYEGSFGQRQIQADAIRFRRIDR